MIHQGIRARIGFPDIILLLLNFYNSSFTYVGYVTLLARYLVGNS